MKLLKAYEQHRKDLKNVEDTVFTWLNRDVCRNEEEHVYDILKEHLTRNTVILDLGCGTGRYAHRLLPYKEYVGVEPWGKMVVFAREWAQISGISKYSFYQKDFRDAWPCSPDIVLTMNVFRHFDDPLDCCRHVWNRLPLGSVWITSFLTHSESDIADINDGDFSTLISEQRMHNFLHSRIGAQNEPYHLFKEVGNWWIVSLQKGALL